MYVMMKIEQISFYKGGYVGNEKDDKRNGDRSDISSKKRKAKNI